MLFNCPQRNFCRLLDYSTQIVPVLNETHAGYWTTFTCYLTRSSTKLMPAIGLQYVLMLSSTKLMPAIGLQSHVIHLSSTELLPAIGLQYTDCSGPQRNSTNAFSTNASRPTLSGSTLSGPTITNFRPCKINRRNGRDLVTLK